MNAVITAEQMSAPASLSGRGALRAELAAAAGRYQSVLQADWADAVLEQYPGASFADVHTTGAGEGHAVTGVDLYDAAGARITVSAGDEASFQHLWGAGWMVDPDGRDGLLGQGRPTLTAFSLSGVRNKCLALERTFADRPAGSAAAEPGDISEGDYRFIDYDDLHAAPAFSTWPSYD